MTEKYFDNEEIPPPFVAKFLKPTEVKISFETVKVDNIHLFYEWAKGKYDIFCWEAFDNAITNYGLIVRVARLNINKDEIPPHERDALWTKIQHILTGRSPIPNSPWRLPPKGSEEIFFHLTNLL